MGKVRIIITKKKQGGMMEFERASQQDNVLIRTSNTSYIPFYQKITFEIPTDVADGFLKLCDKKRLDPDDIVSRLIEQYVGKKRGRHVSRG